MQKSTVHQHSYLALFISAIVARFHAALESIAPVGYQDETGFHMGVQRAPRD